MLEFLLTPVTLSSDKQSEIFHTQWMNSHSVEVPLEISIIIIIIIITIIVTHFCLPIDQERFWTTNNCKSAMLFMHNALKSVCNPDNNHGSH